MVGLRKPTTLIWLSLALGLPRAAGAVDFEVGGDAVVQGYDVVSPWGDPILSRRRLLHTIGLYAYNLEGDPRPLGADFSMCLRLRVDADFGVPGRELDPATTSHFVPGLEQAPVDVMEGYLEGRHLAGGLLDFRLGRQHTADVLGWWSFDGGLVRIVTPLFFQAEIFGGLEQRGGAALSTARWEAQGVWRGRRAGFESRAYEYPSFQPADAPAPAFGFAFETNGSNSVHGRLVYRRVYSIAPAFTQQFPSPAGGGLEQVEGLRISQERIGWAGTAFLHDIGGLRGGFAYDLYNELISRAYGGIDVYLGTRSTLSGEVDFYVPTYDADSIWNWFTHNPSATVWLRGRYLPLPELSLSAGAGTRLWLTDGNPDGYATAQCAGDFGGSPEEIERCLLLGMDPTARPAAVQHSRQENSRATFISPDLLLDLGAAYRWGSGHASFRGLLQTGFGGDDLNRGRRVGGSLAGRQALGDDFWLNGRLSLDEHHNPLRAERDAISFGYVLAPEYNPIEGVSMRLEWEHDISRLVGHRTRLLGLVSFAAPAVAPQAPSSKTALRSVARRTNTTNPASGGAASGSLWP